MNTLIIDNYDSFTYNLYHMFGEVTGRAPVVITNDETKWRREYLRSFDLVIVSPGPGHPAVAKDMGISNQVLQEREIVRPLLGVCLGHQGMCHQLGGRVERAPEPAHGRVETILHIDHPLFQGIPETFDVVRYHSLIASQVPPDLMGIAWTLDGLVMAVSHRRLPMWGVQFHPESACCQYGRELARNVCSMADQHQSANRVMISVPRALEVADRPRSEEAARRLKLFARPLRTRVDPESAFLALQSNRAEPTIWLDSNDHGSPLSCVSVIASASGPDARVVQASVATGYVEWRHISKTEWTRTKARFFDWMGAELQRTRLEEGESADALTFDVRPGWFGYMGYELKAETGGALSHQAELPDAWMFFSDRILVHDHRSGQWWALAAHDSSCEPAPLELDLWATETDEMLAAAASATQQSIDPMPSGLNLRVRHSVEDYERIVCECLKEIQCGESYELCLTNALRFDLDREASDLAMYRRLRRNNPTSFSCFLRGSGWSVLSLSPERFIRVDRHRQAQSRPMKGTRPRGADPISDTALREDLATNVKDRAENLMILDLVRNDLGRSAKLGGVHAARLFEVESYATVHQMTSTVEARLLDEASSVDVVRLAFPPGSMTGAPKVRTMAILDDLEAGPRGVYSGAMGYFALNGAADFNVVIRSLVKIGRRLHLGCGGAVIALSEPRAELEETVVKSRALLSAFGLTFPRSPAAASNRGASKRTVPAAWRPKPVDDASVEAALTRWMRERNERSRLLLTIERGVMETAHRVLAVFDGVLLQLTDGEVSLNSSQAASLQFRRADGTQSLFQGRLCQVDALEADAVFSALPRTDQIKAWTQERPGIEVASVVERYAGQTVARPKTFRVYRLAVWRLHGELHESAATSDELEIKAGESTSLAAA